jgi:predicted Zn-ribbon and HTH transcriptional regulator
VYLHRMEYMWVKNKTTQEREIYLEAQQKEERKITEIKEATKNAKEKGEELVVHPPQLDTAGEETGYSVWHG